MVVLANVQSHSKIWFIIWMSFGVQNRYTLFRCNSMGCRSIELLGMVIRWSVAIRNESGCYKSSYSGFIVDRNQAAMTLHGVMQEATKTSIWAFSVLGIWVAGPWVRG